MENDWKDKLEKSLNSCPTAYERAFEAFRRHQEEFLNQLAESFEPRLIEKLCTMPVETIENRQALARWCNAQLRELGIRIRCPKTGRAAILVANNPGRGIPERRFRILSTQWGDRVSTSFSDTVNFTTIRLVHAPPRIEGAADRIPESRSRPGR